MREVVRHVQAARKAAGLNVDDRISVRLETSDDDLKRAIDEHSATICSETLASQLSDTVVTTNQQSATVEGKELTIYLEKI